MKRLNNKGITTIEVLICFVIIVIITISMYSTISAFNEKRQIETKKERIYTYKNLLTKEIQDDFIKIGLTHAEYTRTAGYGGMTVYTVNCTLKDGTSRQLVVEQLFGKSSVHLGGVEGASDYFMIKYGPPNDLIEYPIPELGSSQQGSSKEKCDPVNNVYTECSTIQDLSINNVLISISEDNILSIYIGFHHPELSTRYGINIICPIDHVSDGAEESQKWDY